MVRLLGDVRRSIPRSVVEDCVVGRGNRLTVESRDGGRGHHCSRSHRGALGWFSGRPADGRASRCEAEGYSSTANRTLRQGADQNQPSARRRKAATCRLSIRAEAGRARNFGWSALPPGRTSTAFCSSSHTWTGASSRSVHLALARVQLDHRRARAGLRPARTSPAAVPPPPGCRRRSTAQCVWGRWLSRGQTARPPVSAWHYVLDPWALAAVRPRQPHYVLDPWFHQWRQTARAGEPRLGRGTCSNGVEAVRR